MIFLEGDGPPRAVFLEGTGVAAAGPRLAGEAQDDIAVAFALALFRPQDGKGRFAQGNWSNHIRPYVYMVIYSSWPDLAMAGSTLLRGCEARLFGNGVDRPAIQRDEARRARRYKSRLVENELLRPGTAHRGRKEHAPGQTTGRFSLSFTSRTKSRTAFCALSVSGVPTFPPAPEPQSQPPPPPTVI